MGHGARRARRGRRRRRSTRRTRGRARDIPRVLAKLPSLRRRQRLRPARGATSRLGRAGRARAISIAAASGVAPVASAWSKIARGRVADAAHALLGAGRRRSPSGSSSTEMLMIPPALATKSGAQTIPRSASATAIASAASWLLAAPAITRQRSSGTVSSSSTPPSAHGATHVDVGGAAPSSGSVQRGAELVGERALALVDVGDRRARRRASASSRASCAADAAEADHRDAAARQRRACRTRARRRPRIAHCTPSAVHGLGSPELPRSTARPVTWSVASAITAMSRSDVPTSSAVR